MASSPRILNRPIDGHRPDTESYANKFGSQSSSLRVLRRQGAAKHKRRWAASRQALLPFRSLDPFRPLREPDRRRRDEERLSRSEQRTANKPKDHLTGKAPYRFESISLHRRVYKPSVPQRGTFTPSSCGLIVNVTPLESTPIRAAPIGSGRLGLSEGFEAEGDVDAVAEDIVLLKDHVAEIDPDPKQDTPFFGDTPLAVKHPALDLYSAAHSVRDARKLRQEPVAGIL
jgi:hypothetical protein